MTGLLRAIGTVAASQKTGGDISEEHDCKPRDKK